MTKKYHWKCTKCMARVSLFHLDSVKEFAKAHELNTTTLFKKGHRGALFVIPS